MKCWKKNNNRKFYPIMRHNYEEIMKEEEKKNENKTRSKIHANTYIC